MTPSEIAFQGEQLMLDPAGALFWPEQALLVVADLHFEKGSSAATRGSLLPPWDTRVTLDRLAGLLKRWRPRTVVALGDSFHDKAGSTRLLDTDQARLRAMTEWCRFVWVLGNHDPTPPDGLAGIAVDQFSAGPLVFRHEAVTGPGRGELCGHHHPKAQITTRGAYVTRACFVHGEDRLMMPALGAYTGGLDVRDPAITRLFPGGGRLFLLGQDRLFSFAYEGAPLAELPLFAT